MSKSFVSSLTGVALARGEIESIDDPVTRYAPMLKGSAYDGVPLRHVLNMASGIRFDENYLDPGSDINKMGEVQIILADWVAWSTSPSAPPAAEGAGVSTEDGSAFGYGYQWWIPPNSDGEFFAVGVYGQYIYINPKAGIVIGKNAAHREFMSADEKGESCMAQNITLFRGIAEHYSDWER